MRHLTVSDIVIAGAVALGVVVVSLAGLPQMLGAHPWWAQQTGIIGSIGGAVLWLVLRRAGVSTSGQVMLAVSTLLVAVASAHFGKQVFAASFAENGIAGRFWYFGWIALAGSAVLVLAPAVARATAMRQS